MALLHAVLSITFRVDQIISGTVVNILAVGLTGYLNRQLFATGAPPGLSVLPSIPFGPLSDLPWIGPIIFQQKPIALTAILLVVVVHVALFRTRWGLRTRAVGEHPLAADTVGVNVNALRYYNVVLGGAFAGMAGAYFTLESVPHFEPLMTNGRGFIAVRADHRRRRWRGRPRHAAGRRRYPLCPQLNRQFSKRAAHPSPNYQWCKLAAS